MIIDHITISNFRTYCGKITIGFNNTPNRNLTLILGRNGAGKTSFLTCLVWGFYGKFMSKVENKFRLDIQNSGGYTKFIYRQFSWHQNAEKELSVKILLSDVYIPSIPCNTISIERIFDINKKKESLRILIDGQENELLAATGYEVFINDFILPIEIAKFFFFDSEKIVSLAEDKSRERLKALKRAYSEVLGLKKYDDLYRALFTLSIDFEKKIKDVNYQEKLQYLTEEKEKISARIDQLETEISCLRKKIVEIKFKRDDINEKIIREGGNITADEFQRIKEELKHLHSEIKSNKSRLKEHMEFIPFLIAHINVDQLADQVNFEMKGSIYNLDGDVINQLFEELRKFKDCEGESDVVDKLANKFRQRLFHLKNNKNISDYLLDYPLDANRTILDIARKTKDSVLEEYKSIFEREKDLRFQIRHIQKKIKAYELQNLNPFIHELKEQKLKLDHKRDALLIEEGNLSHRINELKRKNEVLSERILEVKNKVNAVTKERSKYQHTIRTLEKICQVSDRIQSEKKKSFEQAILSSFQALAHKKSLVQNVSTHIVEDQLDIIFTNQNGNPITIDALSMGEKQLYISAILRALVIESGIDFPVFVDSPFQKLDKEHSKNIISKFYPTISKQVILFIIPEKELSIDEYELIEPLVSSVLKIVNTDGKSEIVSTEFKEKIAAS